MIYRTARASRYFTYVTPVLRSPIIRTYGFLILTIITLIVFIIFAIKPTIETIIVLQKKLQNEKETLTKVNQKAEQLSKGRENLQKLDPTLKTKIQEAVPTNVEINKLVQSLELSSPAQASISAIQFQPIIITKRSDLPSEAKLVDVSFTYNVEGSYENLKTILQNLKGSSRLVSVDNVTFNKVGIAETLLMSVTGKAYYLK